MNSEMTRQLEVAALFRASCNMAFQGGLNAQRPKRLGKVVVKVMYWWLVSVVLVQPQASALAKNDEKDPRPDIVLVMADDLGYSDIGCFGGEIETPNIDGLAADGISFRQFYNAGRCCPTRASLLTGLYAHQAGLGHMVYKDKGAGYHPFLNRNCVTIAEVLGDAGYQTMMAGKWHVGHKKGQWPTDRGFERFYGIHIHVDSYFKVLPGCPVFHNQELAIAPTKAPDNSLNPGKEWYTTDVFTDWSIKFLEESDKDKPFFLYVAYNAPHWPLEAPEENIANYQGKYKSGWDTLRQNKLERMKKLGIVTGDTRLPDSGCPRWESLTPTEQNEAAFRREIYAAQIERMDQNIGRIVKQLKEMKRLENTLFIFLSDNGCCAEGGMFGYRWQHNRRGNFSSWRKQSGRSSSVGEAWSCASNTPFRKHKRWVHEGGIATPLVVHWPTHINAAGVYTDQVGHVVDLMATCVDVAGAEYPKQYGGRIVKSMQGISLVPFLEGDVDALEKERTIFWEHESRVAIRAGDWKLVSSNGKDDGAWELYNLGQSRSEVDNLANQKSTLVTDLKQKWKSWAVQSNVLPWPSQRENDAK